MSPKTFDLKTFLSAAVYSPVCWPSVCLFVRKSGDDVYPVLFFSSLFERLRMVSVQSVELLDLQLLDWAHVCAQLSTSFLGNRSLYWLGDLRMVDEAKKKRIISFLSSYTGPNTLLVTTEQPIELSAEHAWVIELPAVLDKELCSLLLEYMVHDSPSLSCDDVAALPAKIAKPKTDTAIFVEQLFTHTTFIPLDVACLLLRYGQLLGSHQAVFIKHWLRFFIEPEKSLFVLSQHFFARQPRNFFIQWALVEGDFPEVFWLSFWSEQLWRAAFYIRYMRDGHRLEAEKVGHRLPFAFKNKEWKRHDYGELMRAHAFLVKCDAPIKQRGTHALFELLYTKFFSGSFGAS